MNRYVIEGLLKDLVHRNKQIVYVAPTEADYRVVHEQLLDELHSYRWSYNLRRSTEDSIEFRGDGLLIFKAMTNPVLLQGLRADIYVIHGLRVLPFVNADRVQGAITRNAQANNAEIILLD